MNPSLSLPGCLVMLLGLLLALLILASMVFRPKDGQRGIRWLERLLVAVAVLFLVSVVAMARSG